MNAMVAPVRKTDPPEHWKKWAGVKEFLEARTRLAEHHSEWTSNRVLYAHYQRWAHRNGLSAIESVTFGKRLHAACLASATEEVPYAVNGHLCYPVWILDPPQVVEAEREPAANVTKGQVRMKRPVEFRDDVLAEGAVVDWMTPTPYESTLR